MLVKILNDLSLLYNANIFSAEQVSIFTLLLNGGNVYNGFHEIAQLNMAKQLFLMGRPSTLEYSIKSATEKTAGGKCKSYEIDIVSLNSLWEIKPLGGDSAEPQATLYAMESGMNKGMILPQLTNIPVFGKYQMYITYPQRGEAYYGFTYLNKQGERVPITSAAAENDYKRTYYIAVSAVAVIIAITIVEDVLTGGGGVADDPVSVGLAYEVAKAILAFA